jgi:hypothetical protein
VLLTVVTEIVTCGLEGQRRVLIGVNSPTTLLEEQPEEGLCVSRVGSPFCSTAQLTTLEMQEGCATIKDSCMPIELASQSCSQQQSVGAYVTYNSPVEGETVEQVDLAENEDEGDGAPDDGGDSTSVASARARGSISVMTASRPKKPKQAHFVGCCVTRHPGGGAYGKHTCKRIRVGKRFRTRSLKTTPINPLHQLGGCQCYNIRERVFMEMYTKPSRFAPNHYLAHYPFTVGLATRACVYSSAARTHAKRAALKAAAAAAAAGAKPKSVKSVKPPTSHAAETCHNRWLSAGSARVSCVPGVDGAPGTLQVNFTSNAGFMILGEKNVVATCGISKFSDMSSCGVANRATGFVRTSSAASVGLQSEEWDSQCVCTSTGRRPGLQIEVPEVVVGAACKLH